MAKNDEPVRLIRKEFRLKLVDMVVALHGIPAVFTVAENQSDLVQVARDILALCGVEELTPANLDA